VELLFVWEVLVDLVWSPSTKLLDLIQGQRLEVGHADVAHVLGQDLYMSTNG